MVTNPFRAQRMWKQIGVSEPKQHSLSALSCVILWWTASVSGGLLSDCKFPDCTAGRGSCEQARLQLQPAQGQGRKKASFPYILRVGRTYMFPASVFVWEHIEELCVEVLNERLCIQRCVHFVPRLWGRGQVRCYGNEVFLIGAYFISIFISSLWMKHVIKSVCSWLFLMYFFNKQCCVINLCSTWFTLQQLALLFTSFL